MAEARRFYELGMVPEIAKEVFKAINDSGGGSITPPAPIADPETATAEEIATKVNEIITALGG